MNSRSKATLDDADASGDDAAETWRRMVALLDETDAARETHAMDARPLAEHALTLLRRLDRSLWDAEAVRCLYLTGDVRFRVGSVPDAVEVLLEGMELVSPGPDSIPVSATIEHHLHARLSTVYCNLGLYAYALAESNLGLLVAQNRDDPDLLAASWSDIAQVHLSLSDRAGAANAADRAVDAASRAGASPVRLGVAHVFALLASAGLGRTVDAERHGAAAESVEHLLPPAERAGLHIALGELAMRAGDMVVAERRFRQAFDEVEPAGQRYAVFAALSSLASVRLRRADYRAAREILRRALEVGDSTVALTLRCERMMAEALEHLGDIEGALMWEKRAHRRDRRILRTTNEERTRVLDLEHRASLAERQAATERSRAERAEQDRVDSAARYEALIRGSADLVAVLDRDESIRWVSDTSISVLGYPPDELVGRRTINTIPHDDPAAIRGAIADAMEHPGLPSSAVEYRVRHSDGSWRYLSAVVTDLQHDPGVAGIMYVATETTARRWSEALVASQAEVLDLIARDQPPSEVVARLVDTVHGLCSPHVRCEVAWAGGEPPPSPESQEGSEVRRHPLVDQPGRTIGTILVTLSGGHEPTTSEQRLLDQTVQLARIAVERWSTARSLAHEATHDHLTGLPNRVQFERLTEDALTGRVESDLPVAVLFLDLDRFKIVNDGMGHGVGDRLIIEVTERIRATIDAGDIAARFGGDEFTVLRPAVESNEHLIDLAERLIEAIHEPFVHDGAEICLSASIGISVCDQPGIDAGLLIVEADSAMSRAKQRGRDRSEVFDETMRRASDTRVHWGAGLRHAVERGELRLDFQPIVDLADGSVVGNEALLRWSSADFGQVAPGDFIPLAEDTGLIVHLGEWVIAQAAAAIAAQPQPLPIWVNLSVNQISHPSLLATVSRALVTSGIDASLLCFEITETALGIDVDTAADRIRPLRDLGARIAIDDFGTGHSSLDRLQSLPVNVLKIDRSFVAGVDRSERRQALLRAILGLSGSLGMESVAEGVETEAELGCLLANGCDLAQGYLFARPGPLVERGTFDLRAS